MDQGVSKMEREMETEPPQQKKQKLEHENSNPKRENSDDIEDDKMAVDTDRNASDLTGFANLEDIQKLREFKVLDEVKSNEGDSNAEDSDSSDDKSEGVPEEEIEKMLEENLPEDFKAGPKPKEKPYITRTKIVLEEKGVNQFEVLPLDWIVVRHHSGMPIYFHRPSRVCTLSKPYFLGKGNIRRHDIPVSAIPCLAYSRALEEEEKQKEIDRKVEEQIKNLSQKVLKPNTANQNKKYITFIEKQVNFNSKSNKKACPFSNSKNLVTNNLLTDNSEAKEKHNISMEVDYETNENSKEVVHSEVENDNIFSEEATKSAHKNEFTFTNSNQAEVEISEDFTLEAAKQSNIANQEAKITKDVTVEARTTADVIVEKNITGKINIEAATETDEETTHKVTTAEDVILKAKITEDVIVEAKFEGDVSVEVATEAKDESNQRVNTIEGDTVNAKTTVDINVETVTQSNETANKNNEGGEDTTVFDIPANRQPVILPSGEIMPAPRVESVNNSWKTQNLTPEQFHDYCKRLFKFKTINVLQFNRWADRRKYAKAKKTMQYPTLPEGTKLITIPVQNSGQDNGGKGAKRDWVMNMNGGSYLSVFHEYVCRALQKQPVYEYKQLENASTPYQATVFIGGMQYGVGHGSSKRQAKYAAARASIRILIPEMREFLDSPAADATTEPDFSFFDYVNIEDPRIAEFCAATCEPSPHAILRTCLLRNFGASDRHIHTHTNKMACQEIELTMKVGKHSATVVCKNKKTAKQRASQAILQALHPHVRSWGSLLRLYGSKSVKSCKEKKLEEQQITLLQDKARHNEPNYAVLEKLRNEMRKLRERDESVVPIGTLLVTDDLPTHSGSNLNNVDL